jgi:hypothetical protein
MTSEPRRTTKRSPMILSIIGWVLLGAGAAIWFLLPPKFMARTQLHVSVDPPNPRFPETNKVRDEVFMRNQTYLIRDRFVLNAVLRDNPQIAGFSMFKGQPDPLQLLEKKIRVEFPNPEFMDIMLSGDQPEEITAIVSAVTESYLENVWGKENRTRREELDKLDAIRREFIKRTKQKREKIKLLQEQVGPIDEKNMVLQQQIDWEDLKCVKKELLQVNSDLRHLRVELGLHPDSVVQVWPKHVAILNALPGPGLSISHAFVALLHEVAQQLNKADRENRQKIQERLRFLEEMQAARRREAKRLDDQTRRTERDAADLVELKEELDREEKVCQKTGDRILKLELKQDVPARVTPTDQVRTSDGKFRVKAVLSTPNESKRKLLMVSGASLTGLGMLLLVLAAFQFRAHRAEEISDDPHHVPQPD